MRFPAAYIPVHGGCTLNH